MNEYRCRVINASGKAENQILFASTEHEAIWKVSQTGKNLVSIRQVSSGQDRFKSTHSRRKAVLEFTEMMELLLDSGLTLKDALEVASSIGKRSPAGTLARDLLESVKKGVSFANAIDSAPDVFPVMYRGMVMVGDRIGSVERIYPRLAAYLRDRKALKDKLSGALAYPIFILAVMLVGALGLTIFVLPKLEAIFYGFGGNAAQTIRENIAGIKRTFVAVAVCFATMTLALAVCKSMGKKRIGIAIAMDRLLLFSPLLGKFIASWETLNFAFAMETLASGGVPVEQSIKEASSVVINEAYKKALTDARNDVMKGMSISAAFSVRREFPAYLSQWIAVGERSGKTERVFAQIRKYFQAEVEQLSAKFMILVEPSLIVLVGIFVLIIVLKVIIPLFSMYGSLL